VQEARSGFSMATGQLNAVSPLGTLERGYAIVQDVDTGKVLRDTAGIMVGDRIQAILAKGLIEAVVKTVSKKTSTS